jgi:hypothetical protein
MFRFPQGSHTLLALLGCQWQPLTMSTLLNTISLLLLSLLTTSATLTAFSNPDSLGDSLQPHTPALWQTQSHGTGSAVAAVQQQQQLRRSQPPKACHAPVKAPARRYRSSKDTHCQATRGTASPSSACRKSQVETDSMRQQLTQLLVAEWCCSLPNSYTRQPVSCWRPHTALLPALAASASCLSFYQS